MANIANVVDCITSSPVDDGVAAVAAIVTARREAWERSQASGFATPRRCAELRELAITGGPDIHGSEGWRMARGHWVSAGADDSVQRSGMRRRSA